jgi:hypothetical protein
MCFERIVVQAEALGSGQVVEELQEGAAGPLRPQAGVRAQLDEDGQVVLEDGESWVIA